MYPTSKPSGGSWKTLQAFSASLLFFVLFSSTFPALSLAKMSKTSIPQRDFLPPVATINPKLPKAGNTPEDLNDIGPVTLSAITTPAVKTTPSVVKLDNDLGIRSSDKDLEKLTHIQRELDDADLTKLWEATVEKNPVIRFSLEKLATPTDLQKKKSSLFLNKTLNVLLSGATLAATMAPGGSAYYRNMGAMAGRDAIQNIINGKNQPQGEGLSPTEQIQLAGLVDELQGKLLRSYHDYKNTLETLVSAHEVTTKNNTLYNNALASGNEFAMMAAGSSYYKALLAETSMRQKAKLARLQLERLAGPEAVSGLQLTLALPEAKAMLQAADPVSSNENSQVPLPPAPEPD